ncbi:MAG: hypothetical protein R2734_01720 [Nocardioides sp.]
MAERAIQLAVAAGGRAFYTAPIKALVNEKFFALCEAFGPEGVGMLTGDAAVNAEAPSSRAPPRSSPTSPSARSRPPRWRSPSWTSSTTTATPSGAGPGRSPAGAPQAQFLLMSGTLGDTEELRADLSRRTGRPTALVDDAERPVPLIFSWADTPLDETLAELLQTGQGPVYVVHHSGRRRRARGGAPAQPSRRGARRPRRAWRHARQLPVRAGVRPDAGAAGASRDRGAPRGHAAQVPPARGAARAARRGSG